MADKYSVKFLDLAFTDGTPKKSFLDRLCCRINPDPNQPW